MDHNVSYVGKGRKRIRKFCIKLALDAVHTAYVLLQYQDSPFSLDHSVFRWSDCKNTCGHEVLPRLSLAVCWLSRANFTIRNETLTFDFGPQLTSQGSNSIGPL
jgi:hypothetical protein